jgi:hypothetical protein
MDIRNFSGPTILQQRAVSPKMENPRVTKGPFSGIRLIQARNIFEVGKRRFSTDQSHVSLLRPITD